MTIAKQVWASDEPQPSGDQLFNRAYCPEAPPNWFREEPEYAAELYALERHNGKRDAARYTIYVLDTAGKEHKFEVRVGWEIQARVKAA